MVAYLLLCAISQWVVIFSLYGGIVTLLLNKFGRSAGILGMVLAEIKPFYWPSGLIYLSWVYGETSDLSAYDKVMNTLTVLIAWKMLTLIDDDRWKKRRKKLLEKVSEVGGRLVVTPA